MTKLEKKDETIFTVSAPPHVGHYKLEIFASLIPKTRGKLNLPVVATFMVEVKLKTLFREVVAQQTKLDIVAAPSVHNGGQKLALITDTFEDVSYSGGVAISENSAGSTLSGLRDTSPKSHKSDVESEHKRNSIFSLENFNSRKFSIVPESVPCEEGRY